jgi:hypothetical protein
MIIPSYSAEHSGQIKQIEISLDEVLFFNRSMVFYLCKIEY